MANNFLHTIISSPEADCAVLSVFPGKVMQDQVRQIIHLDLDAFFCAVEEQRNPQLCGKPFAVGGSPEGRGVVSSCSYAARQYGVRSAMPMAQALRLCPKLIIVQGHHSDYGQYSRQVMAHLYQLTDQVEQVSIDEAFIDVTHLSESAESAGLRLQTQIYEELNLPCSLGIATNKLVAKIATDFGKQQAKGPGAPRAFTVVPPGEEAAFMAPLRVNMLWGVGPKTAAKLAEINIFTIGDLARIPETELGRRFGKPGWELARRAKGVDNSPIITFHETKSVSQETTFARDIRDADRLHTVLQELSQSVAKQLQKKHLAGTTIRLKLRWQDFSTITRQATLDSATADSGQIAKTIRSLFDKAWQPGRAVRLLGVGVSGFQRHLQQPGLWDKETQRELRLQNLMDLLEDRFGKQVIQRGISQPSSDEENNNAN